MTSTARCRPPDGRPPLLMIGQPMTASGFGALAAHFPDRTVVTYDPRGLGPQHPQGRPVRPHAARSRPRDVHAVIEALGAGPVELFASSGGAVTALALVAAHPGDVVTLVAHEPPLNAVLPDAAAAERARAGFHEAYQAKGAAPGMAAFIAMTSWQGEFTDEYFAQPAPDPAAFGMPAEDDGTRDDPLLSDRVLGDQRLPPRRRRARRGADPGRDRGRRGVRGHLHRRAPPWRPPSCSARRRRCSRATTAASSAASSATPASPRRSRAGCARCSTATDPGLAQGRRRSGDRVQSRQSSPSARTLSRG